jgi:hypothetical protein
MDPQDQKKYVRKLFLEYGQRMPIHAVNCLPEDKIKQILQEYNGEVKGNKT